MSPQRPVVPVVYRHHTRDPDGDIILYFVDNRQDPGALVKSSPVVSIKRATYVALDTGLDGQVGKYLVSTQNTIYEVAMSRAQAEHLAREIGYDAGRL